MTGNPRSWEKAHAEMDFNAGSIISHKADVDTVGLRLAHDVCDIASGGLTKTETLRADDALEVYLQGPTL